jgi:hypothetical protein
LEIAGIEDENVAHAVFGQVEGAGKTLDASSDDDDSDAGRKC